MDTITQLPPAPYSVQQQLTEKKKKLEVAFKEFHKLVSNKVLEQNKTTGVKNTEEQITGNLIRAAVDLDNINVGEGILSLASIAIREQLIIRDRVNELEYELCILKRDFDKLKEKVEGPNGTQKK